jgi:hypothetical protein
MLASSSSSIVQEGITNGNKLYFCITNNANFGQSITFSEISGGGGGVIAGNALSFSGSVLNVNTDGTTIQVNGGNDLELINNDLTITAGDGLSGGGLVELGGSTTIDVDTTVLRTTGGQTISGTLTITGDVITNTLISSSTSSVVSLYDNIDMGPITIGSNSNSTITIGGEGTTINIPGPFVIDNITASASNTDVTIYDNVSTGEINIGTSSSGIFNLGGSLSSITISGDMVVSEPSGNTSVVNRGFVNSKTFKDSVRLATTVDGILASDFENGDIIDGISLVTGNRILIKNQGTSSENGIYTVNASGPPTRTTDAIIGMVASGSAIIVQEGFINSDKLYFCDTDNVDYGDSISFSQISGGGIPALPNSSIQFNNSTSFGGSSNFLWDNSSQIFTIVGQEVIGATTNKFSGTPSTSGSILELQSQTFTDTSGPGTTTNGVFLSVAQPTFTSNSAGSTITNSSSVYISNSPTSDASGGFTPTLINQYSLLIDSGVVGIHDSTLSTSTTTGALIVSGGIGCGSDIRASGNLYATSIISTSDATLKTNIEPLENSLENLNKVECYKYNIIGQHNEQYGLMAQQLQNIGLDQLVTTDDEHLYVNYIQLIPMLIQSVKSLKKEIEELKK